MQNQYLEKEPSIFENDEYDLNESLYPSENFKLITTPNDFNISTIISFLDAGIFKIPDFQRNYVWDINKASKLIESLLIGLPIPQMFLYEKSRNEFYVIDGQQRLMSIYFFVKGRFPKLPAKLHIKEMVTNKIDKKEFINIDFLNDNRYFSNFSLSLDSTTSPVKNRFHGQSYSTLNEDDRTTLELSTIRNMIIKPSANTDENIHSMFEIFNRLNSGGVNLNPQEIRMSLYTSEFLRKMLQMNKNKIWREIILNKSNTDLRLKDVETILRLFGMLLAGKNSILRKGNNKEYVEYQGSITGFLNNVANALKNINDNEIVFYEALWNKFLDEISKLKDTNINFSNEKNSKISITFLESIFYGSCRDACINKNLEQIYLSTNYLSLLKENEEFRSASTGKTTSKNNVSKRLGIAYDLYRNF
ncbi:GmrSD restriction endonuclease domain-containing protein [Glaesserella parasuis]|uniref:GmrSD restriction endonuclease domain-containing protein n=1 Tax=Glaesserella parasuis TaxID=738 RepID=UPI0013661422|nr:DUF262 domain-containing protein [Glaesserella parasuis]